MGLPTYQPTYQQQTFEHTSTKLSNPPTKIPAANLCCCLSQAPNERLTQLSFWQPSWFCTSTSLTGEMMMSLAEKDPMLMMMMSPTEKEPTTEGVIRLLRTHRVGDVQRWGRPQQYKGQQEVSQTSSQSLLTNTPFKGICFGIPSLAVSCSSFESFWNYFQTLLVSGSSTMIGWGIFLQHPLHVSNVFLASSFMRQKTKQKHTKNS